MVGTRIGASLAALLMVACASDANEARLRQAAEQFGTLAEVERPGGHWRGFAEPPNVFDAAIAITPGRGRSLTAVDRTSEFPTVSDLQPIRRRWIERKAVDLNLIAEAVAGATTWTLRADGAGTIEINRSVASQSVPPPPVPSKRGAPDAVGNFSHPLVVDGVVTTTTVALGDATGLVAGPNVAAFLDPSAGTIAVVRGRGSSLDALTAAVPLVRLCAAAEIAGDAVVTGSTDVDDPGCDELWRVDGDTVIHVLGGVGTDVAGVGFADGVVLVASRAAGPTVCGDLTCELTAAVHGPDGTLIRDIGPVPLSARGNLFAGSIAGVPILFSGATSTAVEVQEVGTFVKLAGEIVETVAPGIAERVRTDGALFDGASWIPMKELPLAQPSITEPLQVVVSDTQLAVLNRNAMGLWAPAGSGSSWRFEDLYTWPLYVATENACLNLRGRPGLSGNVIDCLDRGAEFWSDGAHVDLDDERWISVLLPGKRIRGWVAERYLSGVSPDEPAEFYCGG